MHLAFDRGTILVSNLPDSLGPTDLPGLTWDSRVDAFRAPARYQHDIEAALRRRGVAFSDDVRTSDETPPALKPISLREYQARALASWEAADRRGLIVLPTGSGKTRLALAAIAQTRLRTLCLVPTRALLEQWHRALASIVVGRVGYLGDGHHEIEPITIATFESGYRWMPRIGNRFDLLVVDEAHHFGSGLRDEALEMCAATARLGLTATPPEAPDVRARLEALVGATVFENSIADLAGTYLADFDVVTCRLGLEGHERDDYARSMADFERAHADFRRTNPLGTWPEFVGSAMRSEPGRKGLAGWHAAKRLLAYTTAKRQTLRSLLVRHDRSRTLVFTADNATAYRIAREELIMPMTCDIGRRERAEALSRFRTGDLRTLVSARVLNEGVDVPDAEVAVIVAGTLGTREHVQRVGRLLRPVPGKRATIYELVTQGTIEVAQARKRRTGLAARRTA
jgi:superfamily II DNA or RNA helicase